MKKLFLSSVAMMLLMTSCGGTTDSSSQVSSADSSVAASSSSTQGGASTSSSVASSSSSSSEESSSTSSSSSSQEIKKAKIKSITALDYLYSTSNYITLAGVEVGAEYDAGSSVTVSFTAGTYLFTGFSASDARNTYVYVNDSLYHPTFDATTSAMTLTFEMPEVDVDLQYCYMSSNTAGLTWSFEDLGDYSVRGIDLSKAYTSSISLYLAGPENKKITSLTYETDTGSTGDFTSNLVDIGGGVYYLNNLLVNSEGATSVTVSLVTANATEHAITYTGLDKTKIDTAKSILPSKGYEGKQTKISVVPADGYKVSLSLTGVVAIVANGSTTFEMPANDIAVTVALLAPISVSDVTIKYAGHSTTPSYVQSYGFYEYSFTTSQYVEVSTLEQGKSYYFRVQLNSEDYSATGIKLNGGDLVSTSAVTYPTKIANAYQALVTIPADAASLEVEVAIGAKYAITIPAVEDASATISVSCGNTRLTDGSEVAAGSKVTITAYDADYKPYSVAVLDAATEDDISTEVGLSGPVYNMYTFTMPAKAIKLSFTAPSTDSATE